MCSAFELQNEVRFTRLQSQSTDFLGLASTRENQIIHPSSGSLASVRGNRSDENVAAGKIKPSRSKHTLCPKSAHLEAVLSFTVHSNVKAHMDSLPGRIP